MLERNLTVEQLNIGDIVACEKQYMTSSGSYFSSGSGFKVKRKNRKSISLAPLIYEEAEWVEEGIVRIPYLAVVCSRHVPEPEPPPLFLFWIIAYVLPQISTVLGNFISSPIL